MRTVRLPIYGEDGIQQPGYLEVDLTYFIPPSSRSASNQARVVQPPEPTAEWEKKLLQDIEAEAAEKVANEVREYNANAKALVETEWRDLEGIPTKFFEINRFGDIRHKSTGKIMELKIDEDRLKPCVKLIVNREEYWIDGPGLAARMWKDSK